MKLSQIAGAIGATFDQAHADVEIKGLAGIETAGPGELTFVANPRYTGAASTTAASAVIVADDFPELQVPTLRTGNPYLAFARAIELFYQAPKYAPGIHPSAVVHPSAKIGHNASIAAYVVIDQDVVIGDNAVLLPHVVIYRGARIGNDFFAHAHSVVREFTSIGDHVILQNGAVVGTEGFGFAKKDEGGWHKILQSGRVFIGKDVEIQANACVDRASVGETRIADGVKIDNLVQVGHGCKVGENSLLCAQVGLAGSTEIGKNVVLAGQVGVAGHCLIGDGAVATAQSGIPNDVEAGKIVSGYPAVDNKQWLRSVAVFNRLPELARDVRKLVGKSSGDGSQDQENS